MGHMSRVIETDRTRDPRDLIVFISVTNGVQDPTGQATTTTRNGAGDYSIVRTGAGAETIRVGFPLYDMIRTTEAADLSRNEIARGPRINSFDVVYRATTTALTSFTPTFKTTVHADNAAVVATTQALTGSLTLTARANPYVVNLPVTTPVVLDSTMNGWLDLVAVLQAGTVFELWGINVRYDLLI